MKIIINEINENLKDEDINSIINYITGENDKLLLKDKENDKNILEKEDSKSEDSLNYIDMEQISSNKELSESIESEDINIIINNNTNFNILLNLFNELILNENEGED